MLRDYDVRKVRIGCEASDGSPLFIEISEAGFHFYVTESSSGSSHDKPIVKTIDEVWDWVKPESGGKVPLKDRASVKRSQMRKNAQSEL